MHPATLAIAPPRPSGRAGLDQSPNSGYSSSQPASEGRAPLHSATHDPSRQADLKAFSERARSELRLAERKNEDSEDPLSRGTAHLELVLPKSLQDPLLTSDELDVLYEALPDCRIQAFSGSTLYLSSIVSVAHAQGCRDLEKMVFDKGKTLLRQDVYRKLKGRGEGRSYTGPASTRYTVGDVVFAIVPLAQRSRTSVPSCLVSEVAASQSMTELNKKTLLWMKRDGSHQPRLLLQVNFSLHAPKRDPHLRMRFTLIASLDVDVNAHWQHVATTTEGAPWYFGEDGQGKAAYGVDVVERHGRVVADYGWRVDPKDDTDVKMSAPLTIPLALLAGDDDDVSVPPAGLFQRLSRTATTWLYPVTPSFLAPAPKIFTDQVLAFNQADLHRYGVDIMEAVSETCPELQATWD